MSMVTELSKPAARATKLAPMTPAAGPDSAMLIACRSACRGPNTPPFDFITKSGAATLRFSSPLCSRPM